jgi:uncharacterized RDD family membrane protein YckC
MPTVGRLSKTQYEDASKMEERKTRPAAYLKRLGAYLLDVAIMATIQCGQCFILFVPLAAVIAPYADATPTVRDFSNNPNEFLRLFVPLSALYSVVIIYGILSLLEFSLYSALLESSKLQATIGKRAFGLQVMDETGARISFKRALIRAIVKYLTGFYDLIGFMMYPILYLFGLSGLANFGMILVTEKHQGLHDILTHTLVVERKAEMPSVDQRTYNVSGRTVIVTGDNPVLSNIQIGDPNVALDLAVFAEQLSRVRSKIQEQPPNNERDIAVPILKAAADDAQNGDIRQLRERLSMLSNKVGRWVLNFAVDVGANLVAEALIKVAGGQ